MTNGEYLDFVLANRKKKFPLRHRTDDDPKNPSEVLWIAMGEKYGFLWQTAKKHPDRSDPRWFVAEPGRP